MLSEINQAIRRRIEQSASALIVSHIRPDGDAVGALLGLGLALEAAGKQVQMVLSDGLPRSFRHLPGSRKVIRKACNPADLTISVDCADLQRTGEALKGLSPDINIDHHITNVNFGLLNLVVPDAEATSSILAELMPVWGLEINADVAQALMTGIVSDTLGFRTSNTRPQALRIAANLMEKGADLPELYNRALVRRTYEEARLWGQGLSRIEREGRLVWTSLFVDDRVKSAYPGNDDADLINVLSAIEECDISMIFVEQKDNRVKISWRAQPGLDVSQIAVRFGGGGHPAASGAEINGTMTEVQQHVLEETRKLLVNGNGANKNGANNL